MLAIKNVSIEQTDERAAKALGFGLAVATRGTCHMRSRPSMDVIGLPEDLLKKIFHPPHVPGHQAGESDQLHDFLFH